jgi:hypothetical protein
MAREAARHLRPDRNGLVASERRRLRENGMKSVQARFKRRKQGRTPLARPLWRGHFIQSFQWFEWRAGEDETENSYVVVSAI